MLQQSAAGLCLVLAVASASAGAQPLVGRPAPEVELKTLGGERFRLSALKGHPVVMTFWGTWCPPCRKEFPELAEVFRKHGASGLAVVGVNQRDQELSIDDVRRFVDEMATPFTIVLDERGRSRRRYRLVGLPTTVFVDSDGVVRRVVSGATSREQLSLGLAAIGVTR